MPFYERQPYIQPLHQIIKDVMQGDIRVPRFHRPGTEVTWRPEQRGDLLDSIYLGFPTGTLLVWSTTTPIPTYPVVGGFRIPFRLADAGRPQRLLLDGHQRLSTLVQILGPGLLPELLEEGIQVTDASSEDADPAAKGERWVFELNPERGIITSRERFVLLKPDAPLTKTQVPLNIVLNRSKLNRWLREAGLNDAQETAVDSLRDRFREYTLPISLLVVDSLQEALESFRRINSSGTARSDSHTVEALTFDPDNDVQAQFAEARAAYLAPIGWEGVSDTDILRVAAALDGGTKKSIVSLDIVGLANRLRNDRGLVERAFQAVTAATKLLGTCGVHGPECLPYIWQLITLAVHLGRASRANAPEPFNEGSLPAAQSWFWLTTYGEVFTGVNSAVVDRSLAALQDMIDGKDWSRMDRDVARRVRPVSSFDVRTARSMACALAMARYQDAGKAAGSAHHALTIGAEAMQLLRARGRRSRWWELAIITPEPGLLVLREALRRRERGDVAEPNDETILARIGVEALDKGSIEDLLKARSDRLIAKERDFVDKLGLEWASSE